MSWVSRPCRRDLRALSRREADGLCAPVSTSCWRTGLVAVGCTPRSCCASASLEEHGRRTAGVHDAGQLRRRRRRCWLCCWSSTPIAICPTLVAALERLTPPPMERSAMPRPDPPRALRALVAELMSPSPHGTRGLPGPAARFDQQRRAGGRSINNQRTGARARCLRSRRQGVFHQMSGADGHTWPRLIRRVPIPTSTRSFNALVPCAELGQHNAEVLHDPSTAAVWPSNVAPATPPTHDSGNEHAPIWIRRRRCTSGRARRSTVRAS